MTSKEYDKLTEDEKRIKVAELNGWKFDTGTDEELPLTVGIWPEFLPRKECFGIGTFGYAYIVPDYLNDLNAMHEVEQSTILKYGRGRVYADAIYVVLKRAAERQPCPAPSAIFATAAQRAEALVLAMEEL